MLVKSTWFYQYLIDQKLSTAIILIWNILRFQIIYSLMRIEEDIKLDYSDVLFRPKRSTLSSRKDVDLKRLNQFIKILL